MNQWMSQINPSEPPSEMSSVLHLIKNIFNENVLHTLFQSLPHTYVLLVDQNWNLDFITGQELKRGRINLQEYVGKNIQPLLEAYQLDLQPYLSLALAGNVVEEEMNIHRTPYWVRIFPILQAPDQNKAFIVAENMSDLNRRLQETMYRNESANEPLDVTFDDLFDLNDLQQFQDAFSSATGVASIITHPDGTPITRPSNFCVLCNDIIRKTPVGLKNCYYSDAFLGRYHPEGPVVQPCLSGGLWDAGASISVGDKHIANWLIGQIRDETQNEDKVRIYAQQIGADEEAAAQAFRQTTKMSREQFENVAKALYLLASQISALAYQNHNQVRIFRERLKAEKALEENEQKYASYISNAPYAVIISTPEGRMLDVNPMASELTGFTREELLQMSLQDFARKNGPPDAWLPVHFSPEAEKRSFEYQILGKDRFEHWWHIDSVRLDDQRVLHFVMDITEQKKREAEIQEKNDEIATYFNSSLDLMSIIDRDGVFRMLNPEWEKTLGYTVEEMLGTPFKDYIHPEDREKTDLSFKNLYTRADIQNFTNRYRRKDGSYRWIEWRSSTKGELIYSAARDITSRILAEEELRISMSRFQALFQNMTEGCALHELILGQDGIPVDYRILGVNPAFENIIGMSASEVCGKKATEAYQTPEAPYLREYSEVAITGRPVMFTTYFPPLNIHFEISASCPEPNHFVTIFTNINERVRAEEEIRQLNQNLEMKVAQRTAQLEASNRELQAFTYSVSHDLRAPLRGIDGFSQILLEDYGAILPEDGQHYLNQIRKSTQQMGNLIDDLLRLSRILQVELDLSSVNLSEIVYRLMNTLQRENKDRQLRVTIEPGLITRCDQSLIQIALENLIRNAWKFTRNTPDAEIEFGASMEKGESRFYVRDNGAGFDMTYANKLFGAFQRLHSEEEFEGTGIGLAIVQRIIQKHGGQVGAEGKIGKGATFWFTLPQGRSENG